MAFSKGSRQKNGLIIGNHDGFGSVAEEGPERIKKVLDQLRQHHRLDLQMNRHGLQDTGYIRYRQRVDFTAPRRGMAFRVVSGAANITFTSRSANSERFSEYRVHVDYGDWFYVPPGTKFEIMGAVLSGNNLRMVYARLI